MKESVLYLNTWGWLVENSGKTVVKRAAPEVSFSNNGMPEVICPWFVGFFSAKEDAREALTPGREGLAPLSVDTPYNTTYNTFDIIKGKLR